MRLLVVLYLCQTFGLAVDNITFSLITTFTEKTRVTSAVFFSCWSPTGKKNIFTSPLSIITKFFGPKKRK